MLSARHLRAPKSCSAPVAAALVALVAGAAEAAPDVEAKLSPAALDFIANEIPGVLPKSFSFPGGKKQIWDCPLTSNDLDGELKNVKATLNVSKAEVTASSGQLKVVLTGSGSGSGQASVDICYAGSIGCNFSLTVSKVVATATFSPRMSGGKLSVGTPQVSASLNDNDYSLKLSGCGIAGDIANAFISHFKGTVRDWLRNAALGMARDNVGPWIDKSLNSFTSWSGSANGFNFSAALEKVSASSAGLTIGGGLSVSGSPKAACTLPAAPTPAATASSPSLSVGSDHLGIGVSRTALIEAVNAAWTSGLLCLSGDEIAGLDKAAGFVGTLFGLQSTESVSAKAPTAPTVTLLAGSGARVKLKATEFTLTIKGTGPAGPTTVTATADVEATAKLTLQGPEGGVALESVQPQLYNVALKASKPEGLNLSTQLLEQLLADTAAPLIAANFEGRAIVSKVFHQTGGLLDPYYVYLTRSSTTTSHVELFAKLFKKPSSDSGAPTTSFEQTPAAVVKGGPLTLVAQGTDSQTPGALLRYSWRVDGGSWSGADYARGRRLELKSGQHTVEVRAHDLNGNQDATPAKARFTVDATSPTIKAEAPPPVVAEPEVTIPFAVSDNLDQPAEIGVQLHVEFRPAGGAPAELRDDPFRDGLESVTLSKLAPGAYFVSLVARDRVGNMSVPAMINFTVEAPAGGFPAEGMGDGTEPATPEVVANGPGGDQGMHVIGGCAIGATAVPTPLALLLLLLVGWVRRRRAR